jgi:pimeloyl-ACP methyl ester carboxylesterase
MTDPLFAEVEAEGRHLRIEHAWVGSASPAAPLLVFLHEGLGSLSMWKDFPHALCAAGGLRGLVYSRPGYGRSTPRAPGEHWEAGFMHDHARAVLPAFLRAVGVDAPRERPWFFGHSDGGSIALIHAAQRPGEVGGLVVAAPHIMVEPLTITSIEQAREAYAQGSLRAGLARHHADPDSAFGGWSGAWLAPGFRQWTIETLLADIRCPVLAMQGLDDEYGSLAQIDGIAQAAPQTQLLKLPACGHSPHRDQPEAVVHATLDFIRNHPPHPPHPPYPPH